VRLALIQPRSPWGQHPYLPNGLLSVAARCDTAGIKTILIDENLGLTLEDLHVRAILRQADLIGIGCLGSPYIPEALRVGKTLRALGMTQTILVGGEVIMRLTPEQFARIFGELGDVRGCHREDALGALVGATLPSMYDVSMGSVVDALPAYAKRAYFGKEWSLFTSQGCAYNCHFCAASKGQRERFRDPDALRDEVNVLARRVLGNAGPRARYEVYCSTLGGCQTPERMEETLGIVADECGRVGTFFPLRFLATAKCTVRSERHDPGLLRRWHAYGLGCIGVGVDGDDPVVWERENKKHNDASVVRESLHLIAEAGIQPEAFMVIGFPGDDLRAIVRGSRACFRFARGGVRPRPYLGKIYAPGSKGWSDGGPIVESFLNDPRRFRELDYGGLASPATHPDARQRRTANLAFFATTMALKAMPGGCPTQPLLPTESVSAPWRFIGRAWNRMMPQDR